jgi:hypothetical protein
MQPVGKDVRSLTDKPPASGDLPTVSPNKETQEEKEERLLLLLGEVIRMSQAWVRALESGDPFKADKCEAECVAAMERFEMNRKRALSRVDSVDQTQ